MSVPLDICDDEEARMCPIIAEKVAVLLGNSSTEGLNSGVDQLLSECKLRYRPAIYVPTINHLSEAVQVVKRQWSHNSPSVILSLLSDEGISVRCNPDSLKEGLLDLIQNVDTWIVSSGSESDLLARVAGSAFRHLCEEREYLSNHAAFVREHRGNIDTRPQTDSKLFSVNSSAIAPDHDCGMQQDTHKLGNSWHTHFVLLDNPDATPEQITTFRTKFSIHISGTVFHSDVQDTDENGIYISFPAKNRLQEKSGMGSSESYNDTIADVPTQHSVVLCMCSSISKLRHLALYLSVGVPVLIVEDASALCQLLKQFWDAYCRQENFDHFQFVTDCGQKIYNLISTTDTVQCFDTPTTIDAAVNDVVKIVSSATSEEKVYLDFVKMEDLQSNLPLCLIKSIIGNDWSDVEHLFPLFVKLNLSEEASSAPAEISEHLDSEWGLDLFKESLLYPNRELMAQYIIHSGFMIGKSLTTKTFWQLFKDCRHQDFFEIVVLGHLLGYPSFPHNFQRFVKVDLASLLDELSFIRNVFPVNLFDSFQVRNSDDLRRLSTDVMAYWAILMNHGQLAKLFASYSQDPVPLALVLAQICHSLAQECRDWYIYEAPMKKLANDFEKMATSLLEESHVDAPHRSYDVLCHSFQQFGNLTATHLAFQAENRSFIAHGCCQIWVNRLLYGSLQVTNLHIGMLLPSWLKIILCGIFIFPMKWWIRCKSGNATLREEVLFNHISQTSQNTISSGGRIPITQSNCSILSVRSLRQDSLRVSNEEETMAEAELVADTAIDGIGETEIPLNSSDVKNEKFVQWAKSNSRDNNISFAKLAFIFYQTPITKYWISLLFRLIHLVIFGYSLSLPGCGNIYWDLSVWVWTFISCTENIWVLHLKRQYLRLTQLKWEVAEVGILGSFLILSLMFKIILIQPEIGMFDPFTGRCIMSAFFLFLCYTTLFIYIPMSETLGPLLVRIKLMIVRDLINFLILTIIIIVASAIVVHTIIFPDYPEGSALWHQALHWAGFSMFTTDLSNLQEPERCQISGKYERKDHPSNPLLGHCVGTSGYVDASCPKQSAAAYIAVVQYFIILKLISWPLLFALFGKTAKEVDDEADSIWKYQLYSLVTEFSMRPILPPPFTPIIFLLVCCTKTCQKIQKYLLPLGQYWDHPDSVGIQMGSVIRNENYRDPQYHSYWRLLAVRYWRKTMGKTTQTFLSGTSMKSQLCASHSINSFMSVSDKMYGKSQIPLLWVADSHRSFSTLLPGYHPIPYNCPASQFPKSLQPHIQDSALRSTTSSDNERLSLFGIAYHLANSGLPLNPSGRVGISGRGDLLCPGPNSFATLVILDRSGTKALLWKNSSNISSSTFSFPSFFVNECVHPSFQDVLEEFIQSLKTLNGGEFVTQLTDSLTRIRNSDVENRDMKVETTLDTDNAWVEITVYRLTLNQTVITEEPSEILVWNSITELDQLCNLDESIIQRLSS